MLSLLRRAEKSLKKRTESTLSLLERTAEKSLEQRTGSTFIPGLGHMDGSYSNGRSTLAGLAALSIFAGTALANNSQGKSNNNGQTIYHPVTGVKLGSRPSSSEMAAAPESPKLR